MKTRFKLSEEDYRYLFENASDAIWVHDMEGKLVDANRAFEELSGYTLKEWAGMNCTQFLSDESLALAIEVRRKLLNGEQLEQPYEQRLVRKDGATRIIKTATSLVIVNGEIKGFQHIARDVTEEKSVEEMLSKIIDGSPIPSFVINKQHKVTHWNTAIESLSGIRGQEIVGTDEQWRAFYTEKRPVMADLIADGASADEIGAYYHDKYRKSRLIDGAYEAEDFFPAISKHGKWLHFTASPIKNKGGEIIGAIETLRDVTEEKQRQENMRFYVQQVTRSQEDERKRLARDLHDDVAPFLLLLTQRLDAIISNTKPKISSSLKNKLEDLYTQATKALENLRRYAQDLRPGIIDDLGLLAALEWMAENLDKNYGIDTKVKVTGIERDLPDEVQLLLFRIAQEALTNIRRHAEASEAWITLEFGDDKTVLTVKDNGKGFNLPPRIGDLANVRKLGILGMYERGRLLGGNLEVKSEPGKGTTIIMEAPV